MKKLRVLLVLPDPPLPFGNAGARWFYVLIKELVARGHRVTVFSGGDRPGVVEQVNRLFAKPEFDVRCFPADTGGGLAGRWRRLAQPYSYVFGPALRAALDRELRLGYDILHLEQLWSGWLGIEHRRKTLVNVHYSASVDQSGHPPGGLLERLVRLKTRHAETYLLRRYRHICTLSGRLRDFVQTVNPAARLHTVPLGLDAGLYGFEEPDEKDPVVGLVGSFNWTPSYLAGERLLSRLWPAIRARRPDARLLIVGREARAVFGQRCRGDSHVQIEENVPDIIPYFRKMSIMLYAPAVGSGMKTKVLEAFALGTPVVTNNEGTEGLPVVDGVHAGLSDSDEGLVERTIERLASLELCRAETRSARRLIETYCGPQTTVDQIEFAYREVLRA